MLSASPAKCCWGVAPRRAEFPSARTAAEPPGRGTPLAPNGGVERWSYRQNSHGWECFFNQPRGRAMAANQTNSGKTARSRGTRKASSSSQGRATSQSARKSKSRRATSGRPGSRNRNGDFPPTISELTARLRKRLMDLDAEIERIEARYTRAVERLRDAGSPIGIDLTRSWRALTDPARRDIADLLRRLEKVIEPQRMSKRRQPVKSAKTTRGAKARAA